MQLAWLFSVVGLALAVFRDDAGIIDGKDVFVGKPLAVSEDGASLAIIGDAGVLTVLNDRGKPSWRRILEKHQYSSSVALLDDTVVIGGDYLSGFNATNGNLLWMANYPSADIRRVAGEIQVGDELAVTLNGELKARSSRASLPSDSGRIDGSRALLPNGTLSWDKHGVVKYTDKNGVEKYTRDDGLAHIEKAIFVRPFVDFENTLVEEFSSSLIHADSQAPASFVNALAQRMSKHLRQIYHLCSYVVTHGPSMIVLPEGAKEQFELDQTLVALTEFGSVYGLNFSNLAEVEWVYHDLDAKNILNFKNDSSKFIVESNDGTKLLMSFDGEISSANYDISSEKSPFSLLDIDGATVRSPYGWTLDLPGQEIVGKAIRDSEDPTASVTVPADASGSILYKYLNPYAAAFASYSADTKQLVVTIVNTVTGKILSQHTHAEPVIINNEWPFHIAFGEHWVVYTYLSLDASQAPKISVIELYESKELNLRMTPSAVNVFNDTLVPYAPSRTWILPSREQPVYSLGLSKSLFGASAREIILAFEHQIVTLPKPMLNTIAPEDSAVAEVPISGHLSHLHGVSRAKHIVTGSTNLESTYLVAAVGGPDLFVSMSAPSGDFDKLNKSFPKIKLIVFVGLLSFAVATMSPLARMKHLQQQWR